MELIEQVKQGIPLQISPQMAKKGVIHGFTTRLGGTSEGIYASLNLGTNRGDDPQRVRENYRRVCGALGVEMGKLVLSSQVHGDEVRPVTLADGGKGLDRPVDYEADGLITDVPGLTLVVFGADCATILLDDPVRGVIAAVHAGWRGTALGIAARAVEAMVQDYGCERKHILAAIGPCISLCCFETGQEVPQAMREALGEEAAPYLKEVGEGKSRVDLKGLNALWLSRSGVMTTNIDISPDCTLCRPEKYWSHRYTKGERGSQAALISLG
ncbi:MAG: peptidoglycan editing factor PgeF [Oscillospiraceae bacterium]|jgi:YfiH family protein|nr:peptidoglycan editing factor PgeF [Oscillospiraceae bacterium]